MGRFISTRLTAAPVGDANGYLDTTTMADGAYALIANAPTSGARKITMTRTVINAADTPGTVTFVGTDLSGTTIEEVIVPGGHGLLITGTKFFATVASATQAGWVKDAGTADTLVIGWDGSECAVATGTGVLHGVVITTTNASTVTFADATGTLFVLPNSTAVGFYEYELGYSGYLRMEPAGAYDIIAIHSPSGY
jgi:hypothetical protein